MHAGFVPRRFVVGRVDGPQQLLETAAALRRRGFISVETHSPYPLEGTERALGLRRSPIPALVLIGAVLGAVTAYSMIVYMNVLDWPINVGNRPPHSPPANIPITFELAVLFGAAFAFFGLFALCRLPAPYHPLFESRLFERASIDGFVISVQLPDGDDAEEAIAAARAAGVLEIEVIEESPR